MAINQFTFLLALIAMLNHVLISGLHLGIVNTGLFYVCSDLQVSKEGGGATIVTVLSIGACLGALLAGTSADLIGPGKALLWNNVLFLVGTLASAISPEIIGMVVGESLLQLISLVDMHVVRDQCKFKLKLVSYIGQWLAVCGLYACPPLTQIIF